MKSAILLLILAVGAVAWYYYKNRPEPDLAGVTAEAKATRDITIQKA